MDAETNELNDISPQYNEIIIGKKSVKLNFPMKAWKKIKLEYGGIEGIQDAIKDDPIGFFAEKLAPLVFIGILDEKDASLEDIQNEIDNQNIRELKDNFIPVLMKAFSGTLPEKKASGSGTPQKAE